MLIILLVVIALPLYEAISTLALHGSDIMGTIKGLPQYALAPLLDWVGEIPLAGQRVAHEWQTLSDAGLGGLLAKLEPYLTIIARWMLDHAAAVGVFVIHMFVTIIIPGILGILYSQGEAAAHFVTRFSSRLAGQRGAEAVKLAGLAVRAVALGIVVTAVAQSALGGIGLWIAGVPAAGILTAVMLMLCLAQIGPLLPLLGGVAWLFVHGSTVVAILLLVWLVAVARHARQSVVAGSDPAWREPFDAIDPGRRIGRHVRVRYSRFVRRSGHFGGNIDAPGSVD